MRQECSVLSRDKQQGRKLQDLAITFFRESALGRNPVLEPVHAIGEEEVSERLVSPSSLPGEEAR